ncbi:F-box protein CPR1-like [Citrus clementina]|uniref:F-box protein CPR1-like n=1 Tax=Citrus clementina TaxID=85681 RepID=UPI000CED7F37|nr:F-box protein CPR1-like [Citrus x clementina]
MGNDFAATLPATNVSSALTDIASSMLMPEDVRLEILSRLPVKSLMRLRCVCKSWYALIENPKFISKHLENFNDENAHLMISYQVYDDNGPNSVTSLFKDKTLVDLSYENIHRPISRELLGPYDGIFCLCDGGLITLWNPATKECRTLPNYKKNLPAFATFLKRDAIFGLCDGSGDYKVVFICKLWNEKIQDAYEHAHVAVYTSSTDSWRVSKGNIKWIPYVFESYYNNANLNGVFYWFVSRAGDFHSKLILLFRISDEEFQEIQRPCIPYTPFESLAPLNGSIALLHLDESNQYIEIWVMNEMNWIQLFAIGPFLGVKSPCVFWKNNAVLMECNNGKLLLYDLVVQEVRDLGRFSSGELGAAILIYCYKESLIRLKGEEEDSLSDSFDIPWHIMGEY